MTKIQPLPAVASSPSSCSPSGDDSFQILQNQAASYTVWMKSLVFSGNGCTVYGADGRVAFRVDNYGRRDGREAFVMDRDGRTLIGIRRKSFGFFKRWEARRHSDDGVGEEVRPWFTVHRAGRGGAAVTMRGGGRAYTVEGCSRKSDYKITGAGGEVAAAIARKQTAAGVVLGEDVLTLTVGPGVDHLLVLGLVVVFGLMNRCL